MTKQEFITQKLAEARENLASAHQGLMESTDKPRIRISLQRLITLQQQKIELYQEGKLDTDAEIALMILNKVI